MKRHKTVLLADGSEEFRWLVWKCAGEHTYFSMKTVGSGWDILRCVQEQPPDLLLIDTALPDICGLTVLKELARRGSVPKTIVISSVVSERMAAKALSLGAVYFLPKPFHIEALFDLIYGLLHGYPQYPPLALSRSAGNGCLFEKALLRKANDRNSFFGIMKRRPSRKWEGLRFLCYLS